MSIRRLVFLVAALAMFGATHASAAALGTRFTYQGLLRSSGSPVAGNYDFTFKLYSDSTAGSQVGTDQTLLGVSVTGGVFSVSVDFGASAFDGNARWLDIQVRTSGGGGFTQLLPRQPLNAAPYALRALNGGTTQWITDANGIEYGNSVAIGAATHPDWKFYVDTGTNPANTGVFKNNNATYATMFVENDATGGYGFYSPSNTDNFMGGRLVLNSSPINFTRLDVANAGIGVYSQVTGSLINPNYNAALVGIGTTGGGGFGTTSMGVYGASSDDRAIWGVSANNYGVVGDNTLNANAGWLGGLSEGVYGQATKVGYYGGRFTNTQPGGVALRVDGVSQVKTLQILGGADLAERFDAPDAVAPGTVMAIDEASPGRLKVAEGAYCRTVAGVVSGANGLSAGVELSRDEARTGTAPIALSGRVWVKCDATRGAIHPGDLLTTADRAGHAMVARDAKRAAGAILGKAMSSLETGTGDVLVLVSLQ